MFFIAVSFIIMSCLSYHFYLSRFLSSSISPPLYRPPSPTYFFSFLFSFPPVKLFFFFVPRFPSSFTRASLLSSPSSTVSIPPSPLSSHFPYLFFFFNSSSFSEDPVCCVIRSLKGVFWEEGKRKREKGCTSFEHGPTVDLAIKSRAQ